MFNRINLYRIIFYGGLFIIPLVLLFEKKLSVNNQQQLEQNYNKVQQTVSEKEFAFVNALRNELADTNTIQRSWRDITQLALSGNYSLSIFRGDTLMLWTDNAVNVENYRSQCKLGSGYLEAKNGAYLYHLHKKGDYTFVFLYVLCNKYAFKNQYIQNRFNSDLAFITDATIQSTEAESFTTIRSLANTVLFSIRINQFAKHSPAWIQVLILLFLAVWLSAIHALMRIAIVRKRNGAIVLFVVGWICIRALTVYFQVPDFLYTVRLFNPLVYASSTWFPSLGDLWLDSLLLLWLFILLETRYAQSEPRKQYDGRWWVSLVWLLISFLAVHVAVLSIKSLTIDSQISFDISNIYSINTFTFIGLAVVIVQLLTVYFVVRNFTRNVQVLPTKQKTNVVYYASALAIAYAVLCNQSTDISWFQILMAVLLIAVFVAFKTIRLKLNRFQQYFGVTLIISLMSSVIIQHWVGKKEHENRKLYAVKLISQNDITTDYFLKNVETKLQADPLVHEYFHNPLQSKNTFEKRIRQLYFTGYLSKYEVSVHDFDANGYHFKERNDYSYRQLNDIYNNQSGQSINQYFRYLSSNTEAKGYIARFVMEESGRVYGYLFVVLKPKLIQDENRFDELLIEGYRQSNKKETGYSYAVYKDKNLIYQSGDFPYRIRNTWGETAEDFRFIEEDNYEHLIYTDNQPLTVIVSKPINSLLQTVGLFSFIFTLCTIVLILILFVYVGVNAQMNQRVARLLRMALKPLQKLVNRLLLVDAPDALYLRTRIQTSIIFILFITLLISAYFTISFITRQYNSRQTERLMKKVRNVVLTVESENIKQLDAHNLNETEAFVNQLADLYDTDITLFDDKGKVIASSISKLYDAGIISKLMSSDAYFHLRLLKESQFSHEEQIASLTFQAAYAPVFRNKKEVLGYIQLPYFSQRADLNAEISSVVIGFINLYVVLFIIIGLIAYIITRNISYPLALIQERLSATKLGEKNEPIVWQRKDEIGELVAQYNRMISELEQSARKLAETEREGAWREIARQIAHEIKNPLTPMKLSIQHLQRAFALNDPNIKDKLNRTTQLLVKQIDTLSDLATEFSSFAKMPAPVYESIDVCYELQQIVELYKMDTPHQILFTCTTQTELYFDRSYLTRSVGNLIKNGLQAIPDEKAGVVEVSATEHNDRFVFVVKDNGSGMTHEQAEQIFKPYFSTKVSGMGLGLPIVKNMIESGNGNITFNTELNRGTEFTITLPKL